jgi:hypothetical protein
MASPKEISIAGDTLGRLRLGAVVAVVFAAVFLAWLVLKSGDGSQAGPSRRATPHAATVNELKALRAEIGHKVYWAGTRHGYTYELTRTSDGSVYIRYLPKGVPLGAERPDYTTVGTYAHPNAFATLRKAARRRGATVRKIDRRGLAVASRSHPSSVYFAYPKTDLLVEVFDPSPKRALRLVTSGRAGAIR